MKNNYVVYKGIKLEARECPKCKEKIFSEGLSIKATNKIEAERFRREIHSNLSKDKIEIVLK